MSSRPSAFLRILTGLLLVGGLVVVAAQALAAPPLPRQQSGEASARRAREQVRFVLPNGLRVWIQVDRRRPVVRVSTLYKVGWLNEEPDDTGVAHYVEHMVYRETENIRNEDVYGFIDRIGGRWTGGTGPLETSYGETVPSWALEEVLRTGAERMARAVFDPVEFERERNNILTEVNGYVPDTPLEILREQVMATAFEVHPYHYYEAGTWARDNLTVTRDQAYDFYRDYYGPNNAVLAVVGDVDLAETRTLVQKHFGPLERAPRSGEIRTVEPPQRVDKRVRLTLPGERQHLEVVYKAPNTAHPDYPALVVLDRLLAGSGRLQQAVTAAGGDEVDARYWPGPYPYVYRISVTAGESANLEDVLAAIQGEIDRIGRGEATAEELDAARIPAADRVTDGDGSGSGLPPVDARPSLAEIADALTEREVFPWETGPEALDAVREAQERITVADLRAFVGAWLRPSRRTVGLHVLGPSDFVPEWTNGRRMVGERLWIPPQTVAPAPRRRPEPVPARALRPLPDLGIETARRQLGNGVVVRAARRPGPVATLQLRIDLGGAPDPAGKEGLTLLVARLLTGDPVLRSRIEALGAELDDSAHGASGTLAAGGAVDLRARFLPESAEAVVDAVARALTVTSFPPQRIEEERSRLLAEIAATDEGADAEEQARLRVLEMVDPAAGTGPLTPAALARVDDADVDAFVAGPLRRAAVTVALVAPRPAAELVEIAATAFDSVADRLAGAGSDRHRAATTGKPGGDVRLPLPGEPQVAVVAGLPGVGREHPDALALRLLDVIVGMPYYGGRLGWALTKGGLTYSSTAVSTFGARSGHVLLSTVCDTANLEATLQAIREVVAGIAADGVHDWEVREAQASTLGRMLLYGPGPDSGPGDIAVALVDSETRGVEILERGAFSRAVLAITPEQVNAVARRVYRSELLRTVAVGALPDPRQGSPFPAGTFRALFAQ